MMRVKTHTSPTLEITLPAGGSLKFEAYEATITDDMIAEQGEEFFLECLNRGAFKIIDGDLSMVEKLDKARISDETSFSTDSVPAGVLEASEIKEPTDTVPVTDSTDTIDQESKAEGEDVTLPNEEIVEATAEEKIATPVKAKKSK